MALRDPTTLLRLMMGNESAMPSTRLLLRLLPLAPLLIVLSGCKEFPILIDQDPVLLQGVEFFRFRFSGHNSALLFARREVTCVQFCEFLNEISYQREPLAVRHFQPQYRASSAESAGLESVYFVEHNDSNVTRKDGRFVPKAEASASVNCVTFFGAQAYCEWIGERLGKTVALPPDKVWLACATVAQTKQLPIEGCPGGVWEWCSDIVSPEDHSMPAKAVVRGGEFFSRRRARITDKAYSLLLSGGEGEQGQGLRVVVYAAD